MARAPESIGWVDRFVRLRRAFNTERASAPHDVEGMRAALAAQRDGLDALLQEPASWTPALLAWHDRALAALRARRTLARLALLSPAILWFVVGGWPETAGVQRLLSNGPGWVFVVVVSLAAQIWLVWRLLNMRQSWRRVMQSPGGDLPARVILGATASIGVAGFGAFAALEAFGLGWPSTPAGAAHGSDAFSSLPPEQGLPMANCGSVPTGSSGPPPRTSPDWEAWRQGYRHGAAGQTPNYPRDASPEYQHSYNNGYRRSQGNGSGNMPVPTARPPLPGEGSRQIFVPADDGTGGVRKITIHGDKTYLDAREAYEKERINTAFGDGLLNSVAGINERAGKPAWPHPDKWPPPDWD